MQIKYTAEQLKEILSKHAEWLRSYDGSGHRANLSRAILSGANLSRAILSRAILSGANLSRAILSGANLSRAILSGADLSGAILSRANLSRADLSGANLSRADLSGANLSRANLSRANLSRAILSGAKYLDITAARHSIVPESGPFDGWKKCQNGVLVHVRIPAEARRSNATGRKCRAEFVEVLEVVGGGIGTSSHDGITTYAKGKTVRCDTWEENRWKECAGGIHFFITRIEAENY